MLIHQIRNATLIITYKDKKFLIDPWLMPKDYMPGFEMAVNANVRQPRVELPVSVEKIVDVNVRRLRMKIEENPSNPTRLITIWGLGYKWSTNNQ